jgi:HK97 family phage major capsid protein
MPETVERMKTLRRFIENAEIQVRQEADTKRLTFPASSEAEVERWYGTEVLSHEKGAVRLDRAKKGAMPLLFNHDSYDPIGIIEDARLEQGRFVVDAKLFDTERAEEVRTMIDGGLRNVSIMYRSYVIEEDVKKERFTVTDWEPFEVSIVSIPADASVGIGRGHDEREFEVRMIRASQPADAAEETAMPDKATAAAAANAGNDKDKDKGNNGTDAARAATAAAKDVDKRSALDIENARRRAIENFAQANRIAESIRDAWISQGYSLEEVSKDLLGILEERGRTNPQPASRLGLTPAETERFSLKRAILAAANKEWKNAGFELECSRAVAQKLGKIAEDHKFYVPFEAIERQHNVFEIEALARALGRRDLTVGTAGAGGFLVSTDNIGFIEILRNRSVAFRLGAMRLSGLQGSVTVPRQSAAASAFWLSTEATDITESQQTFVQMALAPKNVGAYTEISRQLLLQSSPGVEGIVNIDLAAVVALAVDLAALEGSGAAGQPTGIANTAGIGSVVGTAIDYPKVLEFQTDVATANVMPARGGYATTPAVAALLLQRARFANTDTPLWVGNVWDGQVSGFPAMSSNQLVAASMIFGDWNELVIGEWGVLEVEVNPFANFKGGIIGVRAIYSLDVGVRRPFAFSRATTIT